MNLLSFESIFPLSSLLYRWSILKLCRHYQLERSWILLKVHQREAVARCIDGIFFEASAPCAWGSQRTSALHFCSCWALKYCRVPPVTKGKKTFASLLESWGVPLSLMLHLPSSSHPTAATTAHQLCLSSRHRLLLSYILFLHQQTPSLKHLFPFHCVKCSGRDIFLCTNATSSK